MIATMNSMMSLVSLCLIIWSHAAVKCLTAFDPSSSPENGLLVTVPQGKMRGRQSTTASGFRYKSFQGIPYVKAPVGNLRFKNPESLGSWSGVLDATKLGKSCVQYDLLFVGEFFGVEDCLYLNVYVPNNSPHDYLEQYPVMVWIHGGGFIVGSGDTNLYGPDKIVEQNVIMVSFNYRIGALGFLCFNTSDVPGNVGLKDQAMALKWVKNNIKYFGGNPDQITIFGESAGAASVNYQIISPLSQGLFQQAIVQSGSSMCPWALQSDPVNVGFKLAGVLGLQTNDKQTAIDFLRNIPANDLAMASVAPTFRGVLKLKFSPVVEKIYQNQDSFLTDQPEVLMKSGMFTKVPTLVGLTINEGVIYTTIPFQIGDNALRIANGNLPNLTTFIPDSIISRNSIKNQAIENKIKKFYFESNSRTLNDNYVDLISDFAFGKDITRVANLMSKYSPCYLYVFSYKGSINMADVLFHLTYGAAGHTDELAYLFDVSLNNIDQIPLNDDDKFVTKSVVKLWTDFAKYGNPTADKSPTIPYWEKLNPVKKNCLLIDKDIVITQNPLAARYVFWDELEMYKEKNR